MSPLTPTVHSPRSPAPCPEQTELLRRVSRTSRFPSGLLPGVTELSTAKTLPGLHPGHWKLLMAPGLSSGAHGPDPAPTPSTASPWASAAGPVARQTHTHFPACLPPAVLSPGCFRGATWHLTDQLLPAQDGICPHCSRGLFLEMRHLLPSSICDIRTLYGSAPFSSLSPPPGNPQPPGPPPASTPACQDSVPPRTPHLPGSPTS